jgi:hypothetical protein
LQLQQWESPAGSRPTVPFAAADWESIATQPFPPFFVEPVPMFTTPSMRPHWPPDANACPLVGVQLSIGTALGFVADGSLIVVRNE